MTGPQSQYNLVGALTVIPISSCKLRTPISERLKLQRFPVRPEEIVVREKVHSHGLAGKAECEGTLELLRVHFLVRGPPLHIVFVDEVDGLSPAVHIAHAVLPRTP